MTEQNIIQLKKRRDISKLTPSFDINIPIRTLNPIINNSNHKHINCHEWEASEIINNYLYLGSYTDATHKQCLISRNIKKILNISDECVVPIELYKSLGIEYMNIKLSDHSDADIKTIIPLAISFIAESITSKEPILVHCKMGFSRSPSIVIAYIMRFGNTSNVGETQFCYKHAFRYVKNKRELISPNFGFCIFLLEYSESLGFKSNKYINDSFSDTTPISSPITLVNYSNKISNSNCY